MAYAFDLKTQHIHFNIDTFAFHPTETNRVFFSRSYVKEVDSKSKHFCDILSLKLDADNNPKPDHILQIENKRIKRILVTPDGRFLVLQGWNQFFVYDLSSKSLYKYRHRYPISCIAVHPKQSFVVVGDSQGEIVFYHLFNTLNSGKIEILSKPVTTVYHWHSKSVGDIAFDSEGVHMYSGGQENVLVVWQLTTGRRDYLPRLGAGVLGITKTPDETLLALRCDNNTIKIINSRSRLLQVNIEGVNIGKQAHLLTGLVVESKHNAFVFNGTDGELHFYSPQEDRHISKVQVGFKNPIRSFQDIKIAESLVKSVVFSHSGDWMVTLDVRNDLLNESSIKFWEWDSEKQQYSLHTQYRLSQKNAVTHLCYHPTEDVCVIADKGGRFRIWRLDASEPTEGPEGQESEDIVTIRWVCESVGYYRDSKIQCCTFSSDGSILVVAYGSLITLWDARTNMFLNVLTHPPAFESIMKVNFVSNTPYLVAVTKCRVLVWDITSCKLKWVQVLNPDLVAFDPKSDRFVVFTSSVVLESGEDSSHGCILVYTPASSRPIGYWLTATKKVKALAFLPGKDTIVDKTKLSGVSTLAYLNNFDEFKFLQESSLTTGIPLSKRQKKKHKQKIQQLKAATQQQVHLDKINSSKLSESASVFQLMYDGNESMVEDTANVQLGLPRVATSRRKSTSKMSLEQEHATKLTEQFLHELFQGESHNLPTPVSVYQQFADFLVVKTTSKPNQTKSK